MKNLDSAVFYSNDLNKIIPFYTDLLGFKVEYQQGENYVSFIFENGARLGIKKKVEEREIPGAQTVFINVDDIDTLYKELKGKEVEFIKELIDQDWGKNFSIVDPDKNKVQFVQRK
jgi:predicted enzyme related to lactoylglutathione lyase